MSEFNRMTVVAAAEVISGFHSHSDMEVLEVEWGIAGRYGSASKSTRVAGLAKIAIEEDIEVVTKAGRVNLARALIERAVRAPQHIRDTEQWKKLVAGLRFDGFEITDSVSKSDELWPRVRAESSIALVRMLPTDLPELDFREAESEIERLLDSHGFTIARGHLKQAVSAFNRGEWSSANGELRNLYEDLLNEIANKLGYEGEGNSKTKRDFLGQLQPPFLLAEYNEWNANNQKPQYVQGLMGRLHPHGSHPGLSEEEDATFRLQVVLVTARLFLRRYDGRTA